MRACDPSDPALAPSFTPITDRAWPVLSIEEARAQCRVDPEFGTSPPSNREDPLIMRAVEAATDELEGPDAWLGRALATRTWRLTLSAFPAGAIRIPCPPLQAVIGVSYLDANGERQTLEDEAASPPGTGYRVGTDADGVGYICPVWGKSWPSGGRIQGGAVVIDVVAGYPSAEAVPALIRQFIAFRTGFYFEHREAVIVGTISTALPTVADSLENLRVRGVWP